MEIEGLINHTLKAYDIEKSFANLRLLEAMENIKFWETVQAIHANEIIRELLKDVTHVREILGREDCIKELLRSKDEIPSFRGFPLKTIEFYIHLKNEAGI